MSECKKPTSRITAANEQDGFFFRMMLLFILELLRRWVRLIPTSDRYAFHNKIYNANVE